MAAHPTVDKDDLPAARLPTTRPRRTDLHCLNHNPPHASHHTLTEIETRTLGTRRTKVRRGDAGNSQEVGFLMTRRARGWIGRMQWFRGGREMGQESGGEGEGQDGENAG